MRLVKAARQLLENYHLKAGVFHFYRGEFGPASEFLHKALEEAALTAADRRAAIYFLVQTRISAAEQHLEQGRADRALEEYRAALGVMPSYADVHARLAAVHLDRGDARRAATHLEAAVEINPRFVEGWIRLGRARLLAGEADAARDAFRTALARSEERAREALEAAEAALAAGRIDEAGELYRHAFLEDGDSFRHHLRQGLLMLRQEKWEDAVAELEAAAEIRPRYADVHNYLGVARAEQGDLERARESFRRSVEINPEYLVAWLNLAFTCDAVGDRDAARAALDEVLRREADNAPARHLADRLESEAQTGEEPATRAGEPAP
ncbi:MAG: tetratricopeptide repeat protein [Acidobacteria bacterium]|nr:MAG: tetratricopeptide repeat protein [Acidobacteriota bacterium]